jgi:hypothetical protein
MPKEASGKRAHTRLGGGAVADPRREEEKRRREAAQARTAEVEGGYEVAGRSLKQMISARLEAQLLKDLRELAEQRGVSISDLLRQAAVELVERSRTAPVLVHFRPVGPSSGSGTILGQLTTGQPSAGVVPATSAGALVSGNKVFAN